MSRHTRNIHQRWLIAGTLELVTPTHLSNGDAAFDVDMPLLLDPLEGRPLLTGASLAGALRNYVNEYLNNYVQKKDERSEQVLWLEKVDIHPDKTKRQKGQVERLFGAARRDDEGDQSPLIVHDALSESPAAQSVELRDGVRIDPKSRTAAEGAKYDLQLLPAGTTFDIGFELIVTESMLAKLPQIRQTLALALYGLQSGHIHLGGRKRRGFGECRVTEWQVWRYDLTKAADLKAWLVHGRDDGPSPHKKTPETGTDIRSLLGETVDLPNDQRRLFTIIGKFEIDGSILIRAGFEAEYAPDTAHLESRRNGQMTPVLSGTSLAGVMRSQALRIAHTVSGNGDSAAEFVRCLFGYMPTDERESDTLKAASRVLVKETEITGYKKLVQSRVAIDRFTGGALESALFTEQPVFGGQTQITFSVRPPLELLVNENSKQQSQEAAKEREKKRQQVEKRWQAEKGLLLLVLKDLWTGFLPVGGEASVGRGRLKGVDGAVEDENGRWQINKPGQNFLSGDDPAILQTYVDEFVAWMKGGTA